MRARTLTVLGLFLAACAGDGHEPPAGTGFSVHLSGAEGLARVACVVTLQADADGAGGGTRTTVQDVGDDAVLTCSTPDDTTLDPGGPTTAWLTVKAPGYAWETREVTPADLPFEGDLRRLDWPLTALPAPEATVDYATGFAWSATDPEGTAALEAFTALAVSMATELGPAQVVKFNILDLATTPRVYLQATKRHPLHYPFAHDVLGVKQTQNEYYTAMYKGLNRQGLAGTLVRYPELATHVEDSDQALTAPVVLEFFPNDDLTPDQAVLAARLLSERLPFLALDGPTARLVYLPAGEVQEGQATEAAFTFARAGTAWARRADLYGNSTLQILNPGLAYGTLQRLSPEDLETTVVSYQDLLLLTRLPLELPLVGGTITEERQTPLAHVNLAARTRGTPNLSLLGATSDPRVAPFLGKLVRFEVKDGGFTLAETTLAEAEAFWAARVPTPFTPVADLEFTDLASFAELGFPDAPRVGAKAANLAELWHLLEANADVALEMSKPARPAGTSPPKARSPRGFGVPFRHYEDFFSTTPVSAAACSAAEADCVDEGRATALCAEVAALCGAGPAGETLKAEVTRLLADDGFRSRSDLREAALDQVRHVMRNSPVSPAFADGLTARVTEVFGDARVRLRSSTNSEDLDGFTGAGLYESTSAEATGPDAAADRIRRIWASIWSWRAFEERAWWGVDHLAVRMGVAVTESFPDEAANGVLITENIVDPTVAGMYVNVQKGEVAVTNPTDGALPEIFSIVPGPEGLQVARVRYSSLSPDEPLLGLLEVWGLYLAADQVLEHFAPLYGKNPVGFPLDLEFKLHGPERALFLKQVRPYSTTTW